MRVIIQRVGCASVSVGGKQVSQIGKGLLILHGITHSDTREDADYLARRCSDLRIFEDEAGKMNLSVKDVGGEILVVSQFTLYGDTRKGNRPSFVDAAPPQVAEPLYEYFVQQLGSEVGSSRVQTGVFRAMMDVSLVNQGPVTVTIESKGPQG